MESEAAGHEFECNCNSCHANHDLRGHYGDPDFECCNQEIEALIEIGEWCRQKPKEHASGDMGKGICYACKEEKEAQDGNPKGNEASPTAADPGKAGEGEIRLENQT